MVVVVLLPIEVEKALGAEKVVEKLEENQKAKDKL